jgi:hypothetical protein
MSTLSSSSTLAEIQAAYDDNASYEEDGDATKAAAFITACRMLLRRIPRRVSHGGRGAEEIETSPEQLREDIADAHRWLCAHGGNRRPVTVASFENFRD